MEKPMKTTAAENSWCATNPIWSDQVWKPDRSVRNLWTSTTSMRSNV